VADSAPYGRGIVVALDLWVEWSKIAKATLFDTRLKKPNSPRGEGGKPRISWGPACRLKLIAELPKANDS